MIDTTPIPTASQPPRTVDARGILCPGPLIELIRAIQESQVGDRLAVLSTDTGSRADIPKWVARAGHRLIGVTARAGYDEVVVERMR